MLRRNASDRLPDRLIAPPYYAGAGGLVYHVARQAIPDFRARHAWRRLVDSFEFLRYASGINLYDLELRHWWRRQYDTYLFFAGRAQQDSRMISPRRQVLHKAKPRFAKCLLRHSQIFVFMKFSAIGRNHVSV
jgi:hypothetical protein